MSVKIKNNNEINQMSSCGKIISDVREIIVKNIEPVSYTHLRAHET